jgi:ABC-2 type transport system ATP-binding protein
MTIRSWFEYLASFRTHWNLNLQREYLGQFGLDERRKVNSLSKGEKVQVALIGALCPEPELLILDEPTSGLDPMIRREFIRTVIGAYQDGGPEPRTVFVSTHLISEFEGLIDEFTIIEKGREILNLESDQARDQFKKIRVRFETERPEVSQLPCIQYVPAGREYEFTANGNTNELIDRLKEMRPEEMEVENLSLEEIFLAALKMERKAA